MNRSIYVYRVGDRVRRVCAFAGAPYRPTGTRGTVLTVSERPWPVQVRWDSDTSPSTYYHPDVLEPLSAVERLAELERQ